jgi:hypothetical protein
MKRSKLLMVIGVMTIVFAGLTGAAQAKKPAGSLNVTLDSYEPNNDGFAGPVKAKVLPWNTRWVAVVQGTVSYYAPSQYSTPQSPFRVVCGTPDLSGPLFASPDKPSGGPVGFDPEFIFGRPSRKSTCSKHPLPVRWTNFEIKSGNTWGHPWPLGPDQFAPAADHTYSYPFVAWGTAPQFRLRDRPRTSDNYGELKISLRPATAADCGYDAWRAFQYEDQAACEAALGVITTS